MWELTNSVLRPMNNAEFRSWCERAGMLVVRVRKNPKGCLRAFLANTIGKDKAHIAELSADGKRVYLRKVDDTGREVLCETWEA